MCVLRAKHNNIVERDSIHWQAIRGMRNRSYAQSLCTTTTLQ